MQFVKIKDNDNLVRDLTSGAVINTSKTDYENYIAKKNSSTDMKHQLKQNTDKIQRMESDISEIKSMLISLINKER